MTFLFRSYRSYVTRDKHNPRRRWLMYEFNTPRGVTTLMRRLRVSRVKRTRTVTYFRDELGHWRGRSESREIGEVLKRD
jgi:hypothetical protein